MNAISPLRHVRGGDGDWRHVGGVADGVVRRIGPRVIVRCLNDAAEGDDVEALARFREADQIRRQLGMCWIQVVAVDHVLAEAGP